jgi:16S rRNA U516 pseudouridylate synthase RsuA-like enzyme
MILTEGRNRQVRKMTAAVGHPALRLVRTKLLFLGLDGLLPGEWRYLSDSEVKKINQELYKNHKPGGKLLV